MPIFRICFILYYLKLPACCGFKCEHNWQFVDNLQQAGKIGISQQVFGVFHTCVFRVDYCNSVYCRDYRPTIWRGYI